MEQHFSTNGIDLHLLHDFCVERGEEVNFAKGERLEREGEPARWFALVEDGCFKFVTQGINDGRERITWFSFEGEFVANYPQVLYGQPSQTTIKAMIPSRVRRVSGESLMQFFGRDSATQALRNVVGEHLLGQFQARYLDHYRATPRERYELLLRRCPGIVEKLPLHAIAAFLNVTPKTISLIRRDITFSR